METSDGQWRPIVITFFPMFIAALSLLTSIYNGYLNNRFVDLIENNIARVEYMKTCKEIIEAYFQVKAKAGALSALGAAAASRDEAGATEAIARFGALATYLANLRDERIREGYTRLTLALDKIVGDARQTARETLPKLLEPVDRDFAALNEDCVRSAKA